MANNKYVIVAHDRPESVFWTGTKWHKEYANARIYLTRDSALAEAKQTKGRGDLCVIKNYGQKETTYPIST